MHAALTGPVSMDTLPPSPSPGVDPMLVTPGPWGFVAIAFVAIIVIFLVWDMLRRIRRGRYRDEVREELDAEAQADAAMAAADVDDHDIEAHEDGTGTDADPDSAPRST